MPSPLDPQVEKQKRVKGWYPKELSAPGSNGSIVRTNKWIHFYVVVGERYYMFSVFHKIRVQMSTQPSRSPASEDEKNVALPSSLGSTEAAISE